MGNHNYLNTTLFFGVILTVLMSSVIVDGTDSNSARVLILGAGVSGLQAARTLHDAGLDDFIIIEASDRIGGRVRSVQFAGMTVGVGAQWPKPNSTVDQIVQALNLDRYTSNYDSLTIRNETGHDVTDEADANYEILEKATDTLADLMARLSKDAQIPDMSQRSALRIGGWQPQSAIDKAIEWFEYDFDNGETPEVSSVRTTETVSGYDTLVIDQGGFEQIFDVVAGFLKEPSYLNHTRLDQKVVTIDHTNDVSVIVTCEDGTKYVGEYVLLTFSIGVLQSDLVEFIPPLPEWKDVEIKKFQMAGYTNIYISFPEKFWDDTEWIVYASERRGYYPAFLNYQAEGLYPEGSPVLLAFTTGDESRRVEAQPSWKTKSEIEDVLRKMYGDGIPEATDILVSDWSQNPLTKGSFSNFPVEVSKDCYLKLQTRVDRLFFGGEATSAESFGFVCGGLESGEREANKMLNCLKNPFRDCPAFEWEGLRCDEVDANSARFLYCTARFVAFFVIISVILCGYS